ncbi:FAD-dependent oxidoreductase [candidate division KSB1 bacterium]|nr:FAD-dependent oxidoreductase [candidate division KSB1 bacterium]
MSHPKTAKFLIIGAGPAGLGAAYRLKELGVEDFLVIDAAGHAGGSATSFKDEQGFVWDIGGHVQFSHYQYFDDLMLCALGHDGWLHHPPESWVWMRDRFIPYPFQNNLRYLPKEEMWKCFSGLIELYQDSVARRPNNFREWIHATFGRGVAEIFMEPYNFKHWACPPEEMSVEWISGRVAATDLLRVAKNILFEEDGRVLEPGNVFRFPKRGGTGAIWEAVADLAGRAKICLRAEAAAVSALMHCVELSNGEPIFYEYLLNTTPLNRFIDMVQELSPTVKKAAGQLRHSLTNIVGLGCEGPKPAMLKEKSRMYFPENNCPFYRVTVFSDYSPNNVPHPEKQWSLIAEVSESAHKPVNQETLIDEVVQGMHATKLIHPEAKIVSQWHHRAHYGYPTPSLQRDAILNLLHAELEQHGISSRGRFGGWKYEVSNQDHALMQGVEWVNRMVLGIPETTYFYPGTANANWGRVSLPAMPGAGTRLYRQAAG